MSSAVQATRTEKDSLGTKEIPSHLYYGIQTVRAVENYPISGMRAHPTLISAFGMVKEAAAAANRELGLIDKKVADAIIQAANEVASGKWNKEFVVDVFQAGAGVSFHMNTNEVIANRAVEILGGTLGDYSRVHPNDHVNYGQSTNDVFPTGMRLATLIELEKLYPVLDSLVTTLEKKGKEFHEVLKSGRTHMQDAVPMRLGQEFAAYALTIRRAHGRMLQAAEGLAEQNIGATAVGTGLNAEPAYISAVIQMLSEQTGYVDGPPTEIGESTDYRSANAMAVAILAGLLHRARTGEGQWVDASQSEVGLLISGTTILDWSANGRIWSRYGNRSPYKPAAPHNVYPCAGADRWLTIACFTDAEWRALTDVAGHPEWASDPRFKDLAARLAHQDTLDAVIAGWTRSRDAYETMLALQRAGVPAGVCQTAEDRCDHDPQLAALSWLTEVTGTKIGRWPLAEVPVKLSESPTYIGGRIDRGAPGYGEDNEYVYGDLLGMSSQEIKALAEQGVI
jgi:hypothetical protein